MISKEEVKHIAKLARMELTQEEIESFQKDLSSILDYFEILKKINTNKIEPTFHPFEAEENRIREDKVLLDDVNDEIVKAFPEKKGEYAKVKQVFK